MPIPNISGLSDPLNYNTPFDEQENLSRPVSVPPLIYHPETMVGSTGDVPIPAHNRDRLGNIYPIMPPTEVIEHPGVTLESLAQSAAMQPALKPVSQSIADRISERGSAYSDVASYMTDVYRDAYNLAAAQGIDLKSEEGRQWMNNTITQARGSAQDFVAPSTKDDVVETKWGLISKKTGKPVYEAPEAQMQRSVLERMNGIQSPTLGSSPTITQGPSLIPTSLPKTDEGVPDGMRRTKQLAEQAAQNPELADLPIYKAATTAWDKHLEREDKRAEKDAKRASEGELKPTGEIQKEYGSMEGVRTSTQQLRQKIQELRNNGVKEPSQSEKVILNIAYQNPETAIGAIMTAAATGQIRPEVAEVEAIRAQIESAYTAARAGLSQTAGEVKKTIPTAPILFDSWDRMLKKSDAMDDIANEYFKRAHRKYPSLKRTSDESVATTESQEIPTYQSLSDAEAAGHKKGDKVKIMHLGKIRTATMK